jgi:dTDP-4-dehydrorhamnose reductase
MKILLTGGSGRLGRELVSLVPEIVAPGRDALDITRPDTIARAIAAHRPDAIVHAAAYTDVRGAETERERCWAINVGGTRNLVRAVLGSGIAFVHVSTDYVFEGSRGGYRETDTVGPPRNYYALSKLVAEEVARTADPHVIIRTSFRAREWPHPVAFTDIFTSQDYVDVIAPKIALALRNWERLSNQTVHIATERKSTYDLARRRRPDVRAGSRAEAGVDLPGDSSLDVSRWEALERSLADGGPT